MAALPIVLLPGMHGTGAMMAPLATLLGGNRDVSVITYPERTPLGYDALTDYVSARLPPGRFVILGESFSGPIAIEIAAREPARVAGLILAVSFACAPLPRLLRHLVALVPISPAFSPVVNAVMLGTFARSHPAVARSLRNTLTDVSAATLRLRMVEALSIDKRQQLAATTCPMLCLVGIRDRLIHRHCIRTVLAVRPDTQLRQFDAPHMLLETHTAIAATAILQFCDELPS